jgi:rSAM/selenodomain-associated transferase 1
VKFSSARILIFAKAPVPGQVKTRLIPTLTPRMAAKLHGRLVRETVARLAGAGLAPIELWCSPDTLHPLFLELARTYGLSLHRQEGADLGERMSEAFANALTRGGEVVLLGTDCPSLDGAYVSAALAALEGSDAVLGPAEDGGYVLLGLKRSAPEIFLNMPWGTARVAALTRERLASLGWKWAELPALWDLDRPQDLERYSSLFNAGESAPAPPCCRSKPVPG